MKDIVYFYIGLTTLVLVMVTIIATMNFPFNWVFYTTVLGQALVIFMVYKVLRDKYTTTKTFEEFYGDHPIREQEHYR
jgi:TRAP-type C4-dicarboxylate transport system permease small subunit